MAQDPCVREFLGGFFLGIEGLGESSETRVMAAWCRGMGID